jgi:hypothetical protein
MFRLESYVAPYILGYLGKYINDFTPADFQVGSIIFPQSFGELVEDAI